MRGRVGHPARVPQRRRAGEEPVGAPLPRSFILEQIAQPLRFPRIERTTLSGEIFEGGDGCEHVFVV